MALNLSGPRTVSLSAIKQSTYVRTSLNQDHVLYLADLYDNGANIPPIIVNEQFELIEGRHRLEAMLLLNWTEAKCLIAKSTSPSETLIEAMAANMKGNLPPNQQDIQYVIQQLLNMGVPVAQIREQMKRVLPSTLVKKYVDVVEKRMQRKRVAEAIEAIAEEGITVQAAAKKFGVAEFFIREALGIRKTKAAPELKGIMAGVERRVRALSHQMSATSKELLEAYNEGLITGADIDSFVNRIKQSASRLKRTTTNIEERLVSAKSGVGYSGKEFDE